MSVNRWPHAWLANTPGKRCPRCGERTGRPILRGMLAGDAVRARDEGKIDVVFGGCPVDADDPKYQCSNCEATFR